MNNKATAVSFTVNTDNVWVVYSSKTGDVSASLPLGWTLWSDGRLMATGDTDNIDLADGNDAVHVASAADRDEAMLVLSATARSMAGCTCWADRTTASVWTSATKRWCCVEFVHAGTCAMADRRPSA